MNLFELMDHARLGKTRPRYLAFHDGETIAGLNEAPEAFYYLRSGTVVACQQRRDGGVEGPLQVRRFTRQHEAEPFPVFGAKDFFLGLPVRRTMFVADASSGIPAEVLELRSEHLIDLGRRDLALVLVRELVRDSDLSEMLYEYLVTARDTETDEEGRPVPGFDPTDPRGILTAEAHRFDDRYVAFAQDVLCDIISWRRAGTRMPSIAMEKLHR